VSDGGGEVGVAGEEDDEAVGNDAGELEDGVAELVEHGVGVALGPEMMGVARRFDDGMTWPQESVMMRSRGR